MNRVKMLSTQLGSDDGYTVKTFASGQEYVISDKMMAAFISVGAVELVDDAQDHAPEDKAVHGAPETAVVTAPKRGRPRRG